MESAIFGEIIMGIKYKSSDPKLWGPDTLFSLFSQAMIAYLKGDFVYKSPAVVHVDVNGVGYEVQVSLNTYTKIQQLDKGTLYTTLLVREDAHTLYGFFDASEREMFLHLLLPVRQVSYKTG